MGQLALIGSHGFEELELWAAAEQRRVSAPGGAVGLLDAGDHLMLPRHGLDGYLPAHRIDHGANLAALVEEGCDRALAICSVGSLHAELDVGAFLCPSDFIALWQVDTVFDDERGHLVPDFDPVWRRLVLEAWSAAPGPQARQQGTYWQSPGPRFETPAEVRLAAAHADVVGMTMASECVAACQLGLSYAAICMVDNLANGVGPEPLTRESYESALAGNRKVLTVALAEVLPALAAGSE